MHYEQVIATLEEASASTMRARGAQLPWWGVPPHGVQGPLLKVRIAKHDAGCNKWQICRHMLLTLVPGFALQDRSCRVWQQGLAGGCRGLAREGAVEVIELCVG